jgi:hypothetical protein
MLLLLLLLVVPPPPLKRTTWQKVVPLVNPLQEGEDNIHRSMMFSSCIFSLCDDMWTNNNTDGRKGRVKRKVFL